LSFFSSFAGLLGDLKSLGAFRPPSPSSPSMIRLSPLYSHNTFQVSITLPNSAKILTFGAISVILPQVEIPTAPIGYMGRPVNIPTVKRNGPLIMNVYDGSVPEGSSAADLLVRRELHEWMALMDSQRALDRAPDDEFLGNVEIKYGGGKLFLYKAWPSFLGPLQLANPETGFATYDLQITYDYYTWD